MINVQIKSDEGIVLVEPSGALEAEDFSKLANAIDDFTEDMGHLRGLIIHTKTFPGWEDFSAFLNHMKFVREHHKQIQRIALVTDSMLGEIGPALARHFIAAEVQHFPYDNLGEAKQWIREAT
jgi:hypothetical protein